MNFKNISENPSINLNQAKYYHYHYNHYFIFIAKIKFITNQKNYWIFSADLQRIFFIFMRNRHLRNVETVDSVEMEIKGTSNHLVLFHELK
jgi:hypothetical protein